MADAPKDSDQSMEDILQSIKRIIADEGTPAADAPPAAGSDVLELTELLAEDVAVPEAAPAAAPVEESPVPTMSIDELMAGPAVAPKPEPEPEPVMAAPEPEPESEPEPVAAVAAPRVHAPVEEEPLMSDSTIAAAHAALEALNSKSAKSYSHHASPTFRSGTTVEDLVLESLKPMLKDWLDTNLPSMVRQLVEKEIRRISGGV